MAAMAHHRFPSGGSGVLVAGRTTVLVTGGADLIGVASAGVESAVTAALAAVVGESGSGLAGEIVAQLKERVAAAIAKDSREKVAMWLSLRDAPLPPVAKKILGIETGLELQSSRDAIERTGGPEKLIVAWSVRELARAPLGPNKPVGNQERAG